MTLHASATSSKGAIADAAVDPYLTIADPDLAALYDIVYSPDLVDAGGAPSPVPEPSSWALLLACIGALWLVRSPGREPKPTRRNSIRAFSDFQAHVDSLLTWSCSAIYPRAWFDGLVQLGANPGRAQRPG